MFQQDLPVTLDAMDAAAMEMEALGEALVRGGPERVGTGCGIATVAALRRLQ